jgi:uncharacterized membrane protein
MKALDFLKREWLALAFLLLPTVLTLSYWTQLPDQVPIHWNLQGEINGYQSKNTFLLFPLGINLFVYLLLLVVPHIDPKPRAKQVIKPLRVIRIAIMAFTAVIFGGIIFRAVGYDVDIILIGNLSAILLYLVLGNLMSKFPPNYFAGIRTPWTLEYPEIWRQVHRFASKLWVAGSLILLLFVFRLENSSYIILFFSVTAGLALVPIIHSYLLYRKIRQQGAIDTE